MTVSALLFLALGMAIGLLGLWIDRQYKVIHSLLFMIVLLPLSIFVVTSTGSTIGEGIVISLLVGLLLEMILNRSPEMFNRRFISGNSPLTSQEIMYGISIYAAVTAIVIAVTVF